jgi:hypothetical protein
MITDAPRSTPESVLEDDARSTFVYDDIESSDSFSLAELNVVINAHFQGELGIPNGQLMLFSSY